MPEDTGIARKSVLKWPVTGPSGCTLTAGQQCGKQAMESFKVSVCVCVCVCVCVYCCFISNFSSRYIHIYNYSNMIRDMARNISDGSCGRLYRTVNTRIIDWPVKMSPCSALAYSVPPNSIGDVKALCGSCGQPRRLQGCLLCLI